ncbi:unnamed protein product [Dibothriocephalus latus]|uniref:Uncharacterized protein n=1 Tax=Dibothriocephalus latus TaxID=60516 RepID=A0A3P7M527_DIBLA|nr:unnamed protein product [Dibothriocephalus latus]
MSTGRQEVAEDIVGRASAYIPAFTDVFTEEGFYIFFCSLTLTTFGVVFFLAWHFNVTVTDSGDFTTKARLKRMQRKNRKASTKLPKALAFLRRGTVSFFIMASMLFLPTRCLSNHKCNILANI